MFDIPKKYEEHRRTLLIPHPSIHPIRKYNIFKISNRPPKSADFESVKTVSQTQ